jgi:O-antigen/teichoic acid export membrane protein
MVGLREVILKLSGLITFPIIARSIGVSVLGILGTAQAFTGILFLVADLGLNKSLIKEVSQNKEEGDVIFSNAFVLKAVGLVVAAFIGLFLVKWSGLDELSSKITALVIILGLLMGLHDFLKSLFSAYEKMEYLPLVDGLSKGSIVLAVIMIFVVLKGDIIDFQMCSIFITLGIIFLSLRLFLKGVHRIKFNTKIEMLPSLLRVSIPFMMLRPDIWGYRFPDACSHVRKRCGGFIPNSI